MRAGDGPTASFLAALLLLLALRLGLAAHAGLSHDEAYYWDWSRRLAWGYHDHPPLVAFLIAAGRVLLGESELAVRGGCALLAIGVVALVFGMARRLAGTRAAWLAALVPVLVPLFSLAGILATPDVPLVFFWTASVALCLRAVRGGGRRHWLALGAALGLGGLAKYTMVLLPPALLAALLATPRGRAALRGSGPWLAGAAALLVCAPHLHWLWTGGGGPVAYQLAHGLGAAAGGKGGVDPLRSFGELAGAQLLLVTPILFVLALIALARAGRALLRDPGDEDATGRALLFFPAALPLVFFGVASLLAPAHPNWPAVAYPTLFVLLGAELDAWLRGPRWRWVWAGLALAGVASLHLAVEAVAPLVPYSRGALTMVRDQSGWTGWAQELREAHAPDAAVWAGDYKLAALLAFHLPDHPHTDAPFERRSGAQYALWRERDGAQGSDPPGHAWYFTTGRAERADARAAELLASPELVGTYTQTRRGRELRTVRAYLGPVRGEGSRAP